MTARKKSVVRIYRKSEQDGIKRERTSRELYYASTAGMTVEAWRALSKEERKSKKSEIDAAVKAERAKARQEERERAAIEKLKLEAEKTPRKKTLPKPPSAGMAGATRYSTITGLMSSPSDKKWNLFLRDGPYWNYMAYHICKKNFFRGRYDYVEDAVMNACEKVGKLMVSKRFKYDDVGKGYFRAFLKLVAIREAIDLYKQLRRQEADSNRGKNPVR